MDSSADRTIIQMVVSGAEPDLGDLSALVRLWNDRREGTNLPARARFDPLDLKSFLGRIVLFDVLRDPLRFRFRLVGTMWVLKFGLDPTNTFVDDFPRVQSRSFMKEILGRVVSERMPLMVRRSILLDDGYFSYGMLLMPLAEDGETVDMILVGFDLGL